MLLTTLKVRHLSRYREISRLLWYIRPDLWKGSRPKDLRSNDGKAERTAEELTSDLEQLGPTFVKLGQLLSSRVDLLPPPYLNALARLQDRVEPFPFSDAERIVESELGVRLSKAFLDFETKPLAAASLAQVHRATLRDGRRVAVKVQRPGVRETIETDFEALGEVAALLEQHTDFGRQYHLTRQLDEFRRTLLDELDYEREAENLTLLKNNLSEFRRLVVPTPITDYSTSLVLTMSYVAGRKITSISPLTRLDLDGRALADELFAAYLKQFLIDGFFHADPHPGNVLLTPEGQVALLDVGMVGVVPPLLGTRLLKLLLAVADGRGEDVADLSETVGVPSDDFNQAEFRAGMTTLVARLEGSKLAQIQTGNLVLQIARLAADSGLSLPTELSLLGRALFHLDTIGRILDPAFDPNAAIREHSTDLLRRNMLRGSSGSMVTALLDTKELAERLPGRVNRILQRLADNDLSVRVETIDERMLMTGFQKIANRITLGLVLSALIMGAALLMRVDTPFRILGYPGLAILLFLLAASCGLVLVTMIIVNDERMKRLPPRRP
jgi:ubiquinone biosynthesis protein